jgi:hypothetical protein
VCTGSTTRAETTTLLAKRIARLKIVWKCMRVVTGCLQNLLACGGDFRNAGSDEVLN